MLGRKGCKETENETRALFLPAIKQRRRVYQGKSQSSDGCLPQRGFIASADAMAMPWPATDDGVRAKSSCVAVPAPDGAVTTPLDSPLRASAFESGGLERFMPEHLICVAFPRAHA